MFGIKTTRLVLNNQEAPGILVVHGGKIQTVLPYEFADIDDVMDVGEAYVIPGLVDSHVHINEPGNTQWEGFDSATRAAAAGGVTTLVDMPLNSIPVTTNSDALDAKIHATRGQLRVDLSFWGGVVPEDLGQITELSARGVPGFKTFLVDSGLPEFSASDEETLRLAMPLIKKAGLGLLAHAELDLGTRVEGDPTDYETFMNSRPPSWEQEAIELLIRLCRETGCPIHIVHLAAASCLPTLQKARAEGLPITVETCPHYLVFDSAEIKRGQTQYKCCPPIRDKANQGGLWQGLRDGIIDLVATDHSPCVPELKSKGGGDFLKAWGGIASLQLALPVMWTHAKKRGFEMTDIVRWMSYEPAKLAGFHHLKGQLNPGFDADIVIFDPDTSWTVTKEELEMRHPSTPFLEMPLNGRVLATFLRGKMIYENGKFQQEPSGQVLLRPTIEN